MNRHSLAKSERDRPQQMDVAEELKKWWRTQSVPFTGSPGVDRIIPYIWGHLACQEKKEKEE